MKYLDYFTALWYLKVSVVDTRFHVWMSPSEFALKFSLKISVNGWSLSDFFIWASFYSIQSLIICCFNQFRAVNEQPITFTIFFSWSVHKRRIHTRLNELRINNWQRLNYNGMNNWNDPIGHVCVMKRLFSINFHECSFEFQKVFGIAGNFFELWWNEIIHQKLFIFLFLKMISSFRW